LDTFDRIIFYGLIPASTALTVALSLLLLAH
jgi:hypothetical protein